MPCMMAKLKDCRLSVLAFVVYVVFILCVWLSFKLSPYRYKFKARELDPRILEGGPVLPKKPAVKPPTQPIGFDLEIEKRIQERESKKKSEDEYFEFHSRPCPTKILEDVVVRPCMLAGLSCSDQVPARVHVFEWVL